MNRRELRVLDQFKPGEWLGFIEIRTRYIDSLVTDNVWGPGSFIVAFFSKRRAATWLDLMTPGTGISVAISELTAEGHLERTWVRFSDQEIEQRATERGIDLDSIDRSDITYRLLTRRAKYRITEDGLRVRNRTFGDAPSAALAEAT